MKSKITLLVVALVSTYAFAQSPIKVDFDMGGGRTLSEVHEPGYEDWVIENCKDTTKVINGVTFKMAKGVESEGSGLKSHWYKVGIQAPYYARLVSDGLTVNGGDDYAEVDMTISGLSAGTHSLLTFHNTVDSPEDKKYGAIDVYVNNKRVVEGLIQSNRALSIYDAATAYITFDAEENKPVKISFRSNEDNPGNISWNFMINGFCLDVPNIVKQAKSPFPADLDYHAEVENGNCALSWTAAKDAISHEVYFGTDQDLVTTADKSSTSCYKGSQTSTIFDISNLYSMNNYYWRVDEVDAEGITTKGSVWSFAPRQLAFPEAEGYGRYARGGRGGKVVYVTNLNDDGPGSFREAVTTDIGPRTVLFNVSGIINLKSRIMSKEQITIAGQTAPGKGICFRAAPVGINNESICRFVRIRLGGGTTYDGLGMAGTNHSIVDHCSVSWTIDEAFSSRGAKNITLQRSLISEALNNAGHQNYPDGTEHGYAGTVSGKTASYHHNLLAHCNGRNWSVGDAIDGAGTWVSKLDIFNNVIYNYGSRATDGEVHQLNFVNNYYKKGAATTINYILTMEIKGFGIGTEQAFYSGNIIQNADGTYLNDGTDREIGRRISLASGMTMPDYDIYTNEPFFESYATIHTAKDAYKSVLSNVGCTMPVFDDHDVRIVNETLTGTYNYVGSKTGKKGLIDHENDCDGYENYPEETRSADFDTDMDGLPNWWEEMYGLNPNSPAGDFSDPNADDDKDGYTNLEEYLNWMATPHKESASGEAVTFDLAPYTRGYEKSPSFELVSATEEVSAKVDGNVLTVTPKSGFGGIAYVDFKVTDAEGSTMTRNVAVKVGQYATNTNADMKEDKVRLSVYPNPVTDNLYVSTSETGKINIKLVNVYGGLVMTESMEVFANQAGRMDLSSLPVGVYLLKVQQGDACETIKLIKK